MSTHPLLPEWKEKRLRNRWAGGSQATPCIAATVLPENAELPQAASLEQFWTDTDFIFERKMAEIEQSLYYGCAMPMHYVDQGSSAMAGVLGCPLELSIRKRSGRIPAGKAWKKFSPSNLISRWKSTPEFGS